MDKQKVTLPVVKWGTLKSKYLPESKYVGNDEFTAGSYNFLTNNTGAVEKRPTDVQYNNTSLSGPSKDQFEAIFASGIHHLLFMDAGTLKYTTGDGAISTVQGGFTSSASMEYSMYQNRVYFDNGVDGPSVYDLTSVYGGVTYSVPHIKSMGCQTPSFAPTFAADSAGGSVPTGGHFYKVTFLYYGLEESNGGSSTTLHTVSGGNQTVNLTGIPTGGYGVTARKIYRDNNDGDFLLVGEISDNTTTTFSDSVSSGTTEIPTSNNTPPIFSYVALNLSRLFVAGVTSTPTTLYWSLPGLPDIFDPNNFIVCNPRDPIQGLAVYQGTLYVFNRHSLGTITGLTDDTFEYQEFPGSVGCVDNRSIQIRTIDGVPVLVWLSDRGLYKCNGSTVEYISDPIEDIVNLNIQQATFTTGSNTQSTQADFQAGTASASIDLDTNPGEITTIDPLALYQSQSDWEGGSSLTNVVTKDGSNSLKVVLQFASTISGGSLAGLIGNDSVGLKIPVHADFTGESGGSGTIDSTSNGSAYAAKFVPPRDGTVSSPSIATVGSGVTYAVYTDSGGQPGSIVGSLGSVHVTGGVTYWIVKNIATGQSVIGPGPSGNTAFATGGNIFESNSGSGWVTSTIIPAVSYHFVQDPVAASGTWTSAIYDSHSASAVAASVVNSGSLYPTSTSATIYVDASNDATMSTGITTVFFSNPNGSNSVSTSGLRYWRLRYTLSTTDDRVTPTLFAPTLKFSTTATWISAAIDCTTDVTSYDSITSTTNLPSGTSVAVTVATSPDNVAYSSYGPVGSAVVQRYVKVKVVLSATSDDITSPSVSLVQFSWHLTATFTSSIINIGQVPSGWGVFQNQATLNGGIATFYMRSAASSGGISGATFVAVSNGQFPGSSVSPLQYTQWKVVITSSANQLPAIDSVTVNWFLGNGQSTIRVASLFFNKTYFLAAAEIGQTTNNIVIVYDFEGNWRVFRDVNINSLGLFYNQPFYFDAVRSNIYQWLIAPTGNNSSITMDVRTKAFDLGDINRLKVVRSLRLTGLNTGTTFHVYYSVDRGTTWTEMLNVSGVTGYTTSTNGNKFSQYFVPSFAPGQVTSGTTIMFRVTSTDAFPAKIISLEPVLYVRMGKYLEREI